MPCHFGAELSLVPMLFSLHDLENHNIFSLVIYVTIRN